jgi:hypothetical protein
MKLAVARTLLVPVLLAVSLRAPDAQAPYSGWRQPTDAGATLTFRATAAGSESAHTNLLTIGMVLANGDYAGVVFTPGFDDRGDLCASSVQASANPADLARGAASWFIEGRLVSVEQDRVTFDLRWTRRVNRPGLTPGDSFTSEQRLTLRDGDRGILDLLRSAPSRSGCDSFGITYEMQMTGAAALSRASIGYDLWLVQEDADGRFVTERFQASAQQGRQVDYFFAPVGYTRDGRRVSGQSEIAMNVWGLVGGRVRSDGDIDLTLEASSGFATEGMGLSSTGRTLVTVRPGETIEVPLDLPTGRLARVGDLGTVFGKHRTAVRLTTRRLW